MAAFGDLANILGYDVMSPMYKQITGQSNDPFSMDLGEGTPWLLGAGQAQTLGQFDPGVFDGIDFDWQGSGPGNSGTLSASRGGQGLGSWSQYDTPFGETLKDFGLMAGAAFGGLGLAGAGPFSGLNGLFGGAAPTAEAGAAAGASTGAGAGGSLVYPSIEAGAAGLGGPGSMSMFNIPAAGSFTAGAAGGAAAYPSISGPSAADASMYTMPGKAAASAGNNFSSYVSKLLSPAGMKSAIPALAQIYSGINARNNAKRLAGQISGIGKAGGAYEQELRRQLERRDAAAGRRSQYGPREVELQAKLAQLMSQNGGTLAQLMGQSNSGTNTALQGALIGGSKLLDLFGG